MFKRLLNVPILTNFDIFNSFSKCQNMYFSKVILTSKIDLWLKNALTDISHYLNCQ